jgi:hypothetical protein
VDENESMPSTNAVKFVSGGATFFLGYLLLLMPVTAVLSGAILFVSLPVFAVRLECCDVVGNALDGKGVKDFGGLPSPSSSRS